MNSRDGPQRRSWVPIWLHTCVPTCSLNYTPDLHNFLKWVTLKKETQALQPGVNPAAPSRGWPRGHIVPAQLGHHLWGAGSSPGVSQGSCCCLAFSHVWLCATPWTVAHQAPLFREFLGQEYWSGLPCPLPGDLPHPWQAFFYHLASLLQGGPGIKLEQGGLAWRKVQWLVVISEGRLTPGAVRHLFCTRSLSAPRADVGLSWAGPGRRSGRAGADSASPWGLTGRLLPPPGRDFPELHSS